MRLSPSLALACVLLSAVPAPSRAQAITVTLLGTGTPEPAADRFGPAILVEAGGQRFLFDAGRGATQRLRDRSLRVGDVTRVFLTHLHSDHVVGLPDVWLTGWQPSPFGRRSSPLLVWGPAGTADMVKSLRQAYSEDIRARSGPGIPDSAIEFIGHDIKQGTAYDQDGVSITAFDVDHGDRPAYGYRLDYGGRSVVISGDTRRSDNLIRFAERADVLIHEVMATTPEAQATAVVSKIMGIHTSPEEAGDVFARVKPKLAVYTHISLMAVPARRQALLDTLLPRTRTAYDGPLVVGEDLMTIVITDTVEVRRPR